MNARTTKCQNWRRHADTIAVYDRRYSGKANVHAIEFVNGRPTTVISGECHLGTLVLSDRAHAGSGAHNVFLLKRMVSSSDDVSEGHLVWTVCSIRERGHYSMGCRWFTSRWP